MSDNWVVQNLENALNTWNEKLSEIWQLITQSPEQFKGGTIWNVIVNIHGALQAIGLALLVLFFVVGVMRTCGSFAEVKKPEHALKLFIRFALAKGVVTYGLELMMALFNIVQGVISTIMNAEGFGTAAQTVLPQEIVTAVENCGFFESIPLWAVTLIGGLFITVLSFIMIMSVYGRFFKLYLYTAIAPVPLSTFAGEPSQSVGKSFIKSYAAVCLEGAIIVLACIIFSLFAATPPAVDPNAAAVTKSGSSVANIKTKEYYLQNLFAAMLVPSGNDAAYVVADYCGGLLSPQAKNSQERINAFMEHLNDYLQEQGYDDTVLYDPSGFDTEARTTALDLKKVVESLLEYQWFRDIVSKSSYKATLPDESTQMWKNTNAFLDSTSDYYNGNVKGVKTGSLSDDYNLVVLYQQHGKEFLICSLGSKSNSSRYDDVNYIIKTIDESDYLSR